MTRKEATDFLTKHPGSEYVAWTIWEHPFCPAKSVTRTVERNGQTSDIGICRINGKVYIGDQVVSEDEYGRMISPEGIQ